MGFWAPKSNVYTEDKKIIAILRAQILRIWTIASIFIHSGYTKRAKIKRIISYLPSYLH